jgi:hypothetical protein
MDFLAQLAEGIFPPDAKARIVALLFGYFDESGTDDQLDFTVISGFIGPIMEWSRLVTKWDARLAKDGIETFHYVECKGRNGEYRGWDWETQCKPHLRDLSDIVVQHGIAGLNAGFIGNYPALLKTLPSIFAARYPTAYSLCFEMMIARLRQARQQWSPEPIVLIFANHDQFSGLALERWNEAKKQGRWQEIAHIGYGCPKVTHQLQVADMIAWETRRFMWDKTPVEALNDLPLLSKLVSKEQDMGNTLYESSMDEDSVRLMAEMFTARAREDGRA